MRKFYLSTIVLLLIVFQSTSQVTYQWAGTVTATDYTVPANWNPVRNTPLTNDILSFDTPFAVNVTNVPTQTIGSIRINTASSILSLNGPGNTLTLGSAVPLIFFAPGSILAATSLTIRLANTTPFTMISGTFGIESGTGGKVIINTPLTLDGGVLDFDVLGTGGALITGAGSSITYQSGTFLSSSAGAITWGALSNYYHARNGAAIPAASWQPGATCNITGVTTTPPTGFLGINFSNLTWNCPGQANAVTWLPASSVLNITGGLNLVSTGGRNLQVGASGNVTVNTGSYDQSGGIIVLQAGAGTNTLSVSDNFIHTDGTLNGVGGSSTGTAVLDLKKHVVKAIIAVWQSTSSSPNSKMIFQFSGSLAQNVSISGSAAWQPPIAGTCNVVISNSDIATGVNVTGTLKVINTASPTFPATCTVNGKLTGTGAVAYTSSVGSAGTSLIYNGGFAQTASPIEFPVTGPNNLTIDNSLGLAFPASFNRSLSGTLSLKSGNFAIGSANTLSLNSITLSSQLSYLGGYISSGRLGRYYPTTTLPTAIGDNCRFPFGSGINDRSIYLYFSSATLSGGTPGMVYASHSAIVNVTGIALSDNNPVVTALDKRSNTFWNFDFAPGTFNVGSGGETISLQAVGENIGKVNNFSTLRLTDGVTNNFGAQIATTGSNDKPTVGKSGLTQASILNVPLYIGSDNQNPLIIITYTWTGTGGTSWSNPANWSGGPNYPSAPTEVAIITGGSNQPEINNGVDISVYQLTVGSSNTLTIPGTGRITVFDNVSIVNPSSASFGSTSSFGYASSGNPQNIASLTYGNLTISGTGAKVLPNGTVRVTGNYNVSGSVPQIGLNTFVYAGTGAQTIGAANYYNLTIENDRSNTTLALGNLSTLNFIDIRNQFDVSSLDNYTVNAAQNFIRFSSSGTQTIPGFYYGQITSISNPLATRILDNMGSSDAKHVITCLSMNRWNNIFIINGSKVKFYVSGTQNATYKTGADYTFNDLELSGNLNNFTMGFDPGALFIEGKFSVSLTNYTQLNNTSSVSIIFSGNGNQTIPAFRTAAPNTPAFKYPNIIVQGGDRTVTLGGGTGDSIIVTGAMFAPLALTFPAPTFFFNYSVNPFGGPNGFKADSSTVVFTIGSPNIPVLKPAATFTNNFNNLHINGGSPFLGGDMTIGGNLSVTGTSALPGILSIGNGNTPRVVSVLGNLVINGAASALQATGQVDLNPGTNGSTKLNLAGNLLISGNGQLMGTTSAGTNNGVIVFNNSTGTTQAYSNTNITFNNGMVNFQVGDVSAPSRLALNSPMNLLASINAQNKSTLTVSKFSSLDCGTNNIFSNGSGNAIFNLMDTAILITANTGGVEGLANATNNGSIRDNGLLVRNYSQHASYELNAPSNTNMGFPIAITPFPMANLTLGNNTATASFSLNKSIDVSSVLTLRNLATLAVAESNLNLKSTSTATARLAPVPNNANITYGTNGRFVVERYYPERRAWRLITAPVSVDGTTKSVFDSWQMGGTVTSGSGMYVTGPGASPAANGLDVSPQNNFSLKLFDGTNLIGVPNTRLQKISGNSNVVGVPDNFGMFAFVRGDRSTTNLFNPSNRNNTTLRDTGRVQIKNQVFTLSGAANSFALIGNPYASPVNLTSLMAASTNIDPQNVWIWDPNLNTEQGGYVTFTFSGGFWVPGTPSSTFPHGHIQSSQAFFVKKTSALAVSATIPFAESHKSTNTSNGAFRPMRAQPGMFRTILNLREANDSNNILADGNLVIYDDAFSAGVDDGDAAKFTNIKENLGLLRDTKLLAVERRPIIVADDTLFFRLTKATQRKYQFQFEPTNLNPLLIGFLEDSYTGIKTPVSLTAPTSFNFIVNGDAKSAAVDRFRIVFKTSGAGPLPVTYSSIKAYQQKENIMIDWTVENEINTDRYEIEKSADGVTYKKINTTNAKGITSNSINYKFLDQNALDGNNFYRILSYSKSGTVEYSRILLVKMGKSSGASISIYPNPVTGNSIGLSFVNMKNGIYQMRLVNTLGQTIMTRQINHTEGNGMETLSPAGKLTAGVYQLQVTAPDKSISTIKMIVQ